MPPIEKCMPGPCFPSDAPIPADCYADMDLGCGPPCQDTQYRARASSRKRPCPPKLTPMPCEPPDYTLAPGPMRYATGELVVYATDLETHGFGMPWGHRRSFANRLQQHTEVGNGVQPVSSDLDADDLRCPRTRRNPSSNGFAQRSEGNLTVLHASWR